MAYRTYEEIAELFFEKHQNDIPAILTSDNFTSQSTQHWLAQTFEKREYRQWKFWISAKQATWLFNVAYDVNAARSGYYSGKSTMGRLPNSQHFFEVQASSNGAATMTVSTVLEIVDAVTYLYPHNED